MATHSSILTWRVPGRGNPGGLPSMGSHRVEHDWSNLAAAAAAAASIQKVFFYWEKSAKHQTQNFSIELELIHLNIKIYF